MGTFISPLPNTDSVGPLYNPYTYLFEITVPMKTRHVPIYTICRTDFKTNARVAFIWDRQLNVVNPLSQFEQNLLEAEFNASQERWQQAKVNLSIETRLDQWKIPSTHQEEQLELIKQECYQRHNKVIKKILGTLFDAHPQRSCVIL